MENKKETHKIISAMHLFAKMCSFNVATLIRGVQPSCCKLHVGNHPFLLLIRLMPASFYITVCSHRFMFVSRDQDIQRYSTKSHINRHHKHRRHSCRLYLCRLDMQSICALRRGPLCSCLENRASTSCVVRNSICGNIKGKC